MVRAEGHTELVGDIVLVCTGGNPSQAFLANFQLFLNTNVTSRIVGLTATPKHCCWSTSRRPARATPLCRVAERCLELGAWRG